MKRKAVALLAALTLGGGTGVAVAAIPIGPTGFGPGLAAVGPVSAADGFPVWYRDKTGLRLQNCISADPLCPPVGLPNALLPTSFPDNYPDEAFYARTAATIPITGGGDAFVEMQVEQAFAGPAVVDGDQITFARVRYIIDVPDGTSVKVTTPVGVKTMVAPNDGKGMIKDTEDIGIGSPGDYSGALGGRIGPFLTWDTYPTDAALQPNAVTGRDAYIGDPGVDHKIIGSAYNTNFFRAEAPGINPTPLVDKCLTVDGPPADCIETNLFSVQGKLATTSGVTAEQVTYSRSSAGAGSVDVFASSLPEGQQSIQVSDVPVAPAVAEFSPTALMGSVASDGHYFARVAYTGAEPPTKVQVSNLGDVPISNKTANVVDRITGTAIYTEGSPGLPGSLAVNAVSSDTVAPRILTASGFAALPVPLVAGALAVPALDAPPVAVTVTSDAGGTVKLPVEIVGATVAPISVVAMAGPDQTVSPGQLVTLDGSSSTAALTYAWTNTDGIVLSDPILVKPTFTAPVLPGSYIFTLTATGVGGPSTATVNITVDATLPGIPVIGPATAGDASATVNWTAPPVTGAISGYNVRMVDANGTQVGALLSAAPDAVTLPVSGLVNGTAVRFQVQATGATVSSAFSALSNTVTPASVPSAPVIGIAVAANASATVNWTAPANAATSAITGYSVRTMVVGAVVNTQAVVGNVTSFVVNGLTNGTAYTFDVAAVNAVGTGAPSVSTGAVTPRAEFVAPTVTARTPANGARSVLPTASVTATFSEPVTVDGTMFVLNLGATAVPATVTYNATTRVATLVPTTPLTADSAYSVTLTGVTDSAGNPMVSVPWTFITGPAPTITAISPASGALAVRMSGNVTATFSETITGFTANTVRITKLNGQAVASAISFDALTNVLTINPNLNLASNTSYRVIITGSNTAVRDLAGNPVATRTWVFSTGGQP